MTRLLVDTSVLITWFHSDGEAEVNKARTRLSAHVSGSLVAYVLDLAPYEVGNVLARGLRWAGQDLADQLEDLLVICGAPLSLSPASLPDAAALAGELGLSFYDAARAVAARGLASPAGTPTLTMRGGRRSALLRSAGAGQTPPARL